MRTWSRILLWGSVGAGCCIAALAITGAAYSFVNGFGSQAPVKPNVPPGFEAGFWGAAWAVMFLWPWAVLIGFAIGGLAGLLKSIAGSVLHRHR
jgi:hypothetical protein